MENEDSTLNTEKNERNFGFLTFIKILTNSWTTCLHRDRFKPSLSLRGKKWKNCSFP